MARSSSVVNATTQHLLRRSRRIELAHTSPAAHGLARTTGRDVVDAADQELAQSASAPTAVAQDR